MRNIFGETSEETRASTSLGFVIDAAPSQRYTVIDAAPSQRYTCSSIAALYSIHSAREQRRSKNQQNGEPLPLFFPAMPPCSSIVTKAVLTICFLSRSELWTNSKGNRAAMMSKRRTNCMLAGRFVVEFPRACQHNSVSLLVHAACACVCL